MRFSTNIIALLSLLFSNILFAQQPKIKLLVNNSFKIECYKQSKITKTGSGFILTSNTDNKNDYLCITNEHVLENIDSAILVFSSGEKFPINKVVATLHNLDATVFTFSSQTYFQGLIMKDSLRNLLNLKIELGDDIMQVSSPKGLLNTFSKGNISAFRKVNEKELIQISAPISHGSSGGVVSNNNGIPIGLIVSQYNEGQNLNFCVSFKQIINELLTKNIITNRFNLINNQQYKLWNLEELINNSDPYLTYLYNLFTNDSLNFKKEIVNVENEKLTWMFLFLKAGILIEQKEIGMSLNCILFSVKKYNETAEYLNLASWLNTFQNDIVSNKVYKNDIDMLTELAEFNNSSKYLLNYIQDKFFYNTKNYEKSIPFLNIAYETGKADSPDPMNKRDNINLGVLSYATSFDVDRSLIYSYQLIKDYNNAKKFCLHSISFGIASYEESHSKNALEIIKYYGGYYMIYTFLNNDNPKEICFFYNKFLKSYNFKWDDNIEGLLKKFCY